MATAGANAEVAVLAGGAVSSAGRRQDTIPPFSPLSSYLNTNILCSLAKTLSGVSAEALSHRDGRRHGLTSPPLPDVAAAPVAAARPSPGANAEVAAMLAGAGLVLATTCCSAGGAATAEVRPATRTVTGEHTALQI